MGKAEFLKGIKMIESFYRAEFNQEDLKLWYGALKEIPYEIYIKAIGKLVKTNKFMPTVAEILEQCKEVEIANKVIVVENMKKDGYFKNNNDYSKIIVWLAEGIVPSWLEEDMKKYLKHQKLILEKNTENLEEMEKILDEFK